MLPAWSAGFASLASNGGLEKCVESYISGDSDYTSFCQPPGTPVRDLGWSYKIASECILEVADVLLQDLYLTFVRPVISLLV